MYHSFSFFCWQCPWFYLDSLQILWQVIQILRVNRNIESILFFFFFFIFYVLQAARNNVLLAVPALLYAINNYLKFIMQVKVLTITNFSYHSRFDYHSIQIEDYIRNSLILVPSGEFFFLISFGVIK